MQKVTPLKTPTHPLKRPSGIENGTCSAMAADFQRNVHALGTLPLDCHSLKEARSRIEELASSRQSLFLATPNVNWLTEIARHPEIRDATFDCDLSLVDGMPVFWLGKLLGIPLKERVPGSTLLDQIVRQPHKDSWTLYFLGGSDAAAQSACAAIEKLSHEKVRCEYLNPGYDTLEAMNASKIHFNLNASQPDFVSVSLGLQRGIRWIYQNRTHLRAGVLAPTGAVLNFFSGHIQRAPELLQKIGLEWLWRTLQEPRLMTRYLKDGIILMKLLVSFYLPLALLLAVSRMGINKKSSVKITTEEVSGEVRIRLDGPCKEATPQIRRCFSNFCRKQKNIALDLSAAKNIGTGFLGILLILIKHQNRNQRRLRIMKPNPMARWIFFFSRLDFILNPSDQGEKHVFLF